MDSMTDEASSSLLTGFQDTHSVSDASCGSPGHLRLPLRYWMFSCRTWGAAFCCAFRAPAPRLRREQQSNVPHSATDAAEQVRRPRHLAEGIRVSGGALNVRALALQAQRN